MANARDSTPGSDGSRRRPARRRLLGLAAVVVTLGLFTGGCLLALGAVPADGPETTITGVSGNVTVGYETPAGPAEFDASPIGPDLVTSEWAFVDRSELPPELGRVAGNPDAGVVPVGEMALVGSMNATSRSVGNATVTVVSPSGIAVDPARKTHFISEFVSPYTLGSERTDVTLVAAPDPLPYRGAMYEDGIGYVTRTAFWDGDVGSVWIHEFLHARQAFALDTEMQWFREASAEYLSYRMMQEQYEGVDNEDLQIRLDATPTYPDAVLANDSTWASEDVQYTRGVRLLYRLDAAIRAGSDGEQTIVDVFRRMNEREERISIEDFARIAETEAATEFPWLRAAVTETGPMDGYLGSDDSVFDVSG